MRLTLSIFVVLVALSGSAEAAPLPLFSTVPQPGEDCESSWCEEYHEPNGVVVDGAFWWYPGELGIYSYDEDTIWVWVPRGFRITVDLHVDYQTPWDPLPIGYEVTGHVDGGGGFFAGDRVFTGSRFFTVTVYGDNAQARAYISGTVPEPQTLVMLCLGVAGAVQFRRQVRR